MHFGKLFTRELSGISSCASSLRWSSLTVCPRNVVMLAPISLQVLEAVEEVNICGIRTSGGQSPRIMRKVSRVAEALNDYDIPMFLR